MNEIASNLDFDKEINFIRTTRLTGKRATIVMSIIADSKELAEYLARKVKLPPDIKLINLKSSPCNYSTNVWKIVISCYTT